MPVYVVRGTTAPVGERSVRRPKFMQATKRRVKKRSLRSVLRKNIQVGVEL
jgi:hypothetical protein